MLMGKKGNIFHLPGEIRHEIKNIRVLEGKECHVS